MSNQKLDHIMANDGAGFECRVFRCEKHDCTWSEYDIGCPKCSEEWRAANDCPMCEGSGVMPDKEIRQLYPDMKTSTCPTCNGTGYKPEEGEDQ